MKKLVGFYYYFCPRGHTFVKVRRTLDKARRAYNKGERAKRKAMSQETQLSRTHRCNCVLVEKQVQPQTELSKVRIDNAQQLITNAQLRNEYNIVVEQKAQLAALVSQLEQNLQERELRVCSLHGKLDEADARVTRNKVRFAQARREFVKAVEQKAQLETLVSQLRGELEMVKRERNQAENETAQSQVVANTRKRGYWEGLTPEQFAARQSVKLLEEACELVLCLDNVPLEWACLIHNVGITLGYAREVFDDFENWKCGVALKNSIGETADVEVVICNLAEAQGVNAAQLAVQKSEADIERGLRERVE